MVKEYRYKQGHYVEDSTRGKAISNPRTYKDDGLVQAWVDKRKLAMLSEWLERGGVRTRHMSDVLKYTIDIVVEQLVENKTIDKIEFTSDAEQLLNMRYKANLNPSGRGERNRMHNLQLDEIRKRNVFEGEISKPIDGSNEYVKARAESEDMMSRFRRMQASGELDRRVAEIEKKRIDEDVERQKEKALKSDRIVKVASESRDTRPAEHPVDEEEETRRYKERDEFIKDSDMDLPS